MCSSLTRQIRNRDILSPASTGLNSTLLHQPGTKINRKIPRRKVSLRSARPIVARHWSKPKPVYLNSKRERFHGSALFSPSLCMRGQQAWSQAWMEPNVSLQVVTFDAGGISGHSNHVALYAAMRYDLGWLRWEGLVCLLRGLRFLNRCPLSIWAPRNFIII